MFWLARLLTSTVGEVMITPAPCIDRDKPLTTALERMRAQSLSCLLVVDRARRPVGWLSDSDLSRQAVSGNVARRTVAGAMNAPVAIARADELLIRVAARMQRAHTDVLAVVDNVGALQGLSPSIEDGSLPASGAVLFDDDPAAMASSKQCQATNVRMAFAQGMDAAHIVTLLGAWNRALYEGAAAFAAARMLADGHGSAPCPYALLAMGSVGRGECMLGPDQDNALVYADPPRGSEDAVDRWFARFATHVCTALDQAGLPKCRGGVMASRANWRMSLSHWQQRVTAWTRRAQGQPLRMCDIFFDCHCVHGDADLARALRDGVANAAAHAHFLRALYRADEEHGVALDVFGRLKGDPRPGPGHGQVQLKLTALLPLVGAVRIHALEQRIAATSTLDRLSALATAGVIDRDEHEGLRDAFTQICALLLQRQLVDLEAGRVPANHVAEDVLGHLQRSRLIEGLRAVREFRAALRAQLHAQPMFSIAPAGP
jgi:DNA polymerase-3 subunit epsilon/CBS domain-containing protein